MSPGTCVRLWRDPGAKNRSPLSGTGIRGSVRSLPACTWVHWVEARVTLFDETLSWRRIALIDGVTPDLYTSLPSKELVDGRPGRMSSGWLHGLGNAAAAYAAGRVRITLVRKREEDLPAEQAEAEEDSRVPGSHEHPGRARSAEASARQGP